MPPTPPALIGTYTPPPVKVGDVVRCRYRRARCRVTSWTDAPVSWPRCNQLGVRGGSGLLVADELVRAVCTESAAAIKYHFGVSATVVWRWRRRFIPGQGHVRTPGDQATHRRLSAAGAAAMKAREWTDEERDARAGLSKRLGLRPTGRWSKTGWTEEQDALLGTMPDEDVAAAAGRTAEAVRCRRRVLKVKTFADRRRTPLRTVRGLPAAATPPGGSPSCPAG